MSTLSISNKLLFLKRHGKIRVLRPNVHKVGTTLISQIARRNLVARRQLAIRTRSNSVMKAVYWYPGTLLLTFVRNKKILGN